MGGCGGLDARASYLDSLGAKGVAASAATLGSEHSKLGNSPGSYRLNWRRALDLNFNWTSNSNQWLLLGPLLATAAAGYRDHPSVQTIIVRGAVLHDGIRTSSMCAAPVTVGFFHPTVIFPEQWRQWPQAQLDAVSTHECEHARRRDSLVQWLALLNRALFWFHPVAWWLERHLSALAEEACDNVVLARGHNPREYSEYLIDMARSVMRSGARLNVAGMAMPGTFLPRRIRQIMEGRQAPRISRTRIACVSAACAVGSHPGTKFVLGDLKIKGDVHNRDAVRDRILTAWKDREYDDANDLTDEVMEAGISKDLQDRGYFQVWARDSVTQPLGLLGGKQRVFIIATVTEGDQFRLGNLVIQNDPPDRPLSIPTATLREQFHLRQGDLFNSSEIGAGLKRVNHLYDATGYKVETVQARMANDDAHLWIPQIPSATNAIEISDMRKGTGAWVKKATGK